MDIDREIANLLRIRLEKLADMILNRLYSHFIILDGVSMIFAYLTNDQRLWHISFSSIGLYFLYTIHRIIIVKK